MSARKVAIITFSALSLVSGGFIAWKISAPMNSCAQVQKYFYSDDPRGVDEMYFTDMRREWEGAHPGRVVNSNLRGYSGICREFGEKAAARTILFQLFDRHNEDEGAYNVRMAVEDAADERMRDGISYGMTCGEWNAASHTVKDAYLGKYVLAALPLKPGVTSSSKLRECIDAIFAPPCSVEIPFGEALKYCASK